MVDDAGDSEARGDRLQGLPLSSPRVRIRPWWFPAQDLRNPLVFFLEAWLADSIFGPDRALVPEMEWMSQALLMVDAVDAGNVVEVTVFARPAVQRQVKSVLLSQASVLREQRARAEKMEQLEEFLKAHAPGPQVPQHPVT
ncbi:OOEP [Cervus elaphus hippelaphus]|uniref:OOEP n=1 Tax=Cervus elaphus hippelaphus TaxID=46360 RepID=A0A212C681_CEREH|nr:oocyte-expressed protein homolog [Cervus canadensis]XP_043746177.1 oocyte-expressed protein homolog [Cervus elaphus]KAF4025036.1 hypothetical protein G4228_017185 [Cervus hanglu yarkandensis]OWK01489.1 OOEP [Cervus elaphus hippelaphus]